MVGLVDHNDFESLFGGLIDLLCLSDFLEQVLDDDTVIVADIGWCDFKVVYRGHDIEFEFAVAAGLKNPRIDLDLFYTGAVELFQCSDDASLLAGA